MEKSNMNGNIYQKLEYLNNLLKKFEFDKKSILKKKILIKS